MHRIFLVVVVTVLAVAMPSRFGWAEEILLRDGRTFDVTVDSTEPDSVRVRVEGSTSGTVDVPARSFDPHSFYDVRSRHMEATAKNHLQLAKYCAEQGLFARARSQVEKARRLDADYVERKMALPDLVEGVASSIVGSAAAFLAKGDLDEAKRYASTVLTDFPETPAAEEAGKLIAKIEVARAADEAAELQAATEALKDQESSARKALDTEVRPLVRRYEAARKLHDDALREKSTSRSIEMFEAAAKQFEAVLESSTKLAKKHEDNATLSKEINRARERVTADAVGAWVNAGGVELSRGSIKKAGDYGKKALALDPKSPAATAFRSRVELAAATSDKYWRTRRR